MDPFLSAARRKFVEYGLIDHALHKNALVYENGMYACTEDLRSEQITLE